MIEKRMQEWMALHGEEPYGRRWKAWAKKAQD